MKKLISIQSVSDIITNSSSEVFIMDANNVEKAGEILSNCEIITLNSIKAMSWSVDDLDFICNLAEIEIDDELLGIQDIYYKDHDLGLLYWSAYVDEHIDQFNKIIGKALIEVGDENGWEYVEKRVKNLVKYGAKHADGRTYAADLGLLK